MFRREDVDRARSLQQFTATQHPFSSEISAADLAFADAITTASRPSSPHTVALFDSHETGLTSTSPRRRRRGGGGGEHTSAAANTAVVAATASGLANGDAHTSYPVEWATSRRSLLAFLQRWRRLRQQYHNEQSDHDANQQLQPQPLPESQPDFRAPRPVNLREEEDLHHDDHCGHHGSLEGNDSDLASDDSDSSDESVGTSSTQSDVLVLLLLCLGIFAAFFAPIKSRAQHSPVSPAWHDKVVFHEARPLPLYESLFVGLSLAIELPEAVLHGAMEALRPFTLHYHRHAHECHTQQHATEPADDSSGKNSGTNETLGSPECPVTGSARPIIGSTPTPYNLLDALGRTHGMLCGTLAELSWAVARVNADMDRYDRQERERRLEDGEDLEGGGGGARAWRWSPPRLRTYKGAVSACHDLQIEIYDLQHAWNRVQRAVDDSWLYCIEVAVRSMREALAIWGAAASRQASRDDHYHHHGDDEGANEELPDWNNASVRAVLHDVRWAVGRNLPDLDSPIIRFGSLAAESLATFRERLRECNEDLRTEASNVLARLSEMRLIVPSSATANVFAATKESDLWERRWWDNADGCLPECHGEEDERSWFHRVYWPTTTTIEDVLAVSRRLDTLLSHIFVLLAGLSALGDSMTKASAGADIMIRELFAVDAAAGALLAVPQGTMSITPNMWVQDIWNQHRLEAHDLDTTVALQRGIAEWSQCRYEFAVDVSTNGETTVSNNNNNNNDSSRTCLLTLFYHPSFADLDAALARSEADIERASLHMEERLKVRWDIMDADIAVARRGAKANNAPPLKSWGGGWRDWWRRE